jgi:hypothetical protein
VDIRIDRLRLQVSGLHPDAARELGRLLAEQLAATVAAAPPASGATRFTSLRISVPVPAGQPPGALAPAMAAEISRALRTAATGTPATGTPATGTPATGAAVTGTGATAPTGPTAHPGAAR